jgi:hypothetical protein
MMYHTEQELAFKIIDYNLNYFACTVYTGMHSLQAKMVAFLNKSYNKVYFGFNKHVSYSAYNTKSLGASISFQLPLRMHA